MTVNQALVLTLVIAIIVSITGADIVNNTTFLILLLIALVALARSSNHHNNCCRNFITTDNHTLTIV